MEYLLNFLEKSVKFYSTVNIQNTYIAFYINNMK